MSRPLKVRRLLQFDRKLQRRQRLSRGLVAGLDEVGRGPLAGPVVAGAVVLHRFHFSTPIDDSKRLSPRAREAAYRQILPNADVGIGFAVPEEIDRMGIHLACRWAMRRALEQLPVLPALVLVDGLWAPSDYPCPCLPIVRGDQKSLAVACASIVAKVIRDRLMRRIHRLLPEYGFSRHKGYGTVEHIEALRRIGPSLFHRYTFQPIRTHFMTSLRGGPHSLRSVQAPGQRSNPALENRDCFHLPPRFTRGRGRNDGWL